MATPRYATPVPTPTRPPAKTPAKSTPVQRSTPVPTTQRATQGLPAGAIGTSVNGGYIYMPGYGGQQGVLGAGTGPARTGAAAPVQASNSPIIWDDNAMNGGGGNGGQPGESDINDLYAPQLAYLSQLEGELGVGRQQQLGEIDTQYGAETAKLTPEQESLYAGVQSQEQRFNNDIRSAYDEAYRAQAALQQQARARFGRNTSTFGAVSDLANQEFARQAGKVGQEDIQGKLGFEQERGKIKTYIQGKVDELDKWKREAIGKINDNFTQMISQINANRVATEQQKTRDKMGLLQQTIAQSQQIQQSDREFKRQLALFAVEQIQSVSGRQFTPAEIKAQIGDIMASLGDMNVGASSVAQGAGLQGTGGQAILGDRRDELAGLTKIPNRV